MDSQTSGALPIAEILRKALAAFGPNGERWGQGTENIGYSKLLCFNVAVYHVTHENEGLARCDEANRILRDAGGFRHGRESMEWNDAPERTFSDVKTIYEKAIAKAETGQ